MIKGELIEHKVIVADKKSADKLYQKSYFGSPISEGKLQLSLIEALYLIEVGKLKVMEDKKELSFDQLMKRAREVEDDVLSKYLVYKDLRSRGYIVKTGLKYGSHYRIYRRGAELGKEHGPYLLHVYPETARIEMQDFLAKARVAHSVRKKLLLAIVDKEGSVTYYEYSWFKP